MLSIKRPRRLQAVPALGPYEVHVGALSSVHVGLTVIVCRRRNTVSGRLQHVPQQSMGDKRLLVVDLGEFRTALHPAAKVWVVPEGYKARVVIEPDDQA